MKRDGSVQMVEDWAIAEGIEQDARYEPPFRFNRSATDGNPKEWFSKPTMPGEWREGSS